MLYGFIDESETRIIKYFIADLAVFTKCNVKPIAVKQNNPPDSELAVFNVNQFPNNFILKNYQTKTSDIV